MSDMTGRATDRADVLLRLRALEPQLRACGLRSLHLFGSTARDEARSDSDIDLFVEFVPNAAIGWDYAGTPELLSRELGRKIDLTTRRSLHPLLKSDIEREAIQVF